MDPYGRFSLGTCRGGYPVDVELVDGYRIREDPGGKKVLVTPLGTYWGQLAAVSVVVSLPVLLMVWFIQRHLARGLSFGAVK